MTIAAAAGSALVRRAEMCLASIASQNARINAFITLRPASKVLAEVKLAAAAPKRLSPLHGRTVAIKDNYCTTDMPTTCASKVLENFVSPYESTPTTLLRNAGAVVVGKANMDEFAMGTNNDHTYFGKCLNPLYEGEYSPGGSSGGSAAAVAADMCDVALGSDTGGSVRLPSAYCGVVGYKPSYGLISRNGVIAYAQSLDTVGILAKKVELVEQTFDILNAYDEQDPTSLSLDIRQSINDRVTNRPLQGRLTIGIMEEAIIDLSPEVREAWVESLNCLRELGHDIQIVSVPSLKNALPTYFIVSPAEASSNLGRYDGIRYGFRNSPDRDQEGNLYAPTRSAAFGHEVQRRILLGTYNLSAGQYGNHFEKAQRVRRRLQLEFDSIFSAPNVLSTSTTSPGRIDVLINPTARTRAPSLQSVQSEDNATDAYINDVLTVPANLAGLPAISVPWGKNQDAVGIQVIGQFGDDRLVLEVAKILEAAQVTK